MTITWRNFAITNPPKRSPESIAKTEKELGVKLPADFLAVAAMHQGRACSPNCFDLPDGSSSALGYVSIFEDEPRDDRIVSPWNNAVAVPDGVIPFSRDGGGDLICFDYRKTPDHPTVVFRDHEKCDDPPLYVACSFTDFLNKLYDEPD
ncbi:MAG: SMI1/KNR4 family protein [Alphaproteobacteria bacterium]|nr:SMI1/KNR4 family protein [Alphaproteobacteria bacterium]